jgi:hypothetical protein
MVESAIKKVKARGTAPQQHQRPEACLQPAAAENETTTTEKKEEGAGKRGGSMREEGRNVFLVRVFKYFYVESVSTAGRRNHLYGKKRKENPQKKLVS